MPPFSPPAVRPDSPACSPGTGPSWASPPPLPAGRVRTRSGGKLPAGKSLLVRSSIHKLYFPRRYHRPPHPAQESGPERRLWTNTAKEMRDVPEDFDGPADFDGNATSEVAGTFSPQESFTAAVEALAAAGFEHDA